MYRLSQPSSSASGSKSLCHTRPQSKPLLLQYPKERQGTRERSFLSTWYKFFSLLEYFEDSYSCFCYPCQLHAKDSTKQKTFIKTGLSNWKVAMENRKGFKKHEQSEVHKQAMATWRERENFVINMVKPFKTLFTSGQNIKYLKG